MAQYELETSSRFERQYKKLTQEQKVAAREVIEMLLSDIPLEPKHRDHALVGNFHGFRECHIRPDLLLIYKKDKQALLLSCVRIGSHSDLFK